jgi:TonB family protein
MKRTWFRFIVIAILVSAPAFAQHSSDASSKPRGPESGNILNRVYVNEFLGFSFPIPEGWQVNSDEIGGNNGEVKAKVTPGGGLILLVIDQHIGGRFFNRIVLTALDEKDVSVDTLGFVSKFVRAQLGREGMSLVRDAFPVDVAGKHFFREDYKESSADSALYKAFVCTRFRGYFLGWTLATASSSELEEAVNLLHRIEFQDDHPLLGTSPGDQSTGIVGGVIGSVSPQSPSGRPLRVRVSQRVSEAMLITKVPPKYPPDARKASIQGVVVLQSLIDTNGNVKEVKIVTGDPLLTPAAMDAVKQWKYKPYLLNGQPVEVDTQVVVAFQLSAH